MSERRIEDHTEDSTPAFRTSRDDGSANEYLPAEQSVVDRSLLHREPVGFRGRFRLVKDRFQKRTSRLVKEQKEKSIDAWQNCRAEYRIRFKRSPRPADIVDASQPSKYGGPLLQGAWVETGGVAQVVRNC